MGIFKNISINSRLILLSGIPIMALGFLASIIGVERWERAQELSEYEETILLAGYAATTIRQLGEERALIEGGERELLRGQRLQTDDAFGDLYQYALELKEQLSPHVGEVLSSLKSSSRRLEALRAQLDESGISPVLAREHFGDLIELLVSLIQCLKLEAPTASVMVEIEAGQALMQAGEIGSRERDIAALALRREGELTEAEMTSLYKIAVRERSLLRTFEQHVSGDLRRRYGKLLHAPWSRAVARLRLSVAHRERGVGQKMSEEEWLEAANKRLAALRGLETLQATRLLDKIHEQALGSRRRFWGAAGMYLFVAALTLTLMYFIQRSITQPLRAVKLAALNLSRGRLEYVAQESKDEIGLVASAFNILQDTVERMASEIQNMQQALQKGRTDVRGKGEGFRGKWSELVGGMNLVLDRFGELNEELEQDVLRQRALRHLGAQALTNVEERVFLVQAAEAALQGFAAGRCLILQRDAAKEKLSVRAIAGGALGEEAAEEELYARFFGDAPANNGGGARVEKIQGEKRVWGVIVLEFSGACPPDDKVRPFLLTLSQLCASFLRNRDAVTGRKTAEEALRHSQKMEAIGRLAGGLAHDFNNLLTVILGFSNVLLEGMSHRDPNRENAEQLMLAGERARELIKQLLAVSRRQELEIQELDIDLLILGFQKFIRQTLESNIELVVEAKENTRWVKADSGALHQIFLNLAVNARHAMPGGGVLRVCVTDYTLPAGHRTAEGEGLAPGDYVCVSVSDTGCGISPENLCKIFEPFFTTKGEREGTGLGLAMVYGLVRQFSGWIEVVSKENQGTTFRVFLPRTEHVDKRHASRRALPVSGGSETILLVEDTEIVRRFTSQILARMGYTVLEASDGEEGLECLLRGKEPIDLLISDVMMPRLSGPEMLAKAREGGYAAGVLFITGYGQEGLPGEIKADPLASALSKPFLPDDLARAIRELFSKVENRGIALAD